MASSGSKVVEHLSQHPKVKGLSLTVIAGEKMTEY
jgi:hypothetical protein